MRAEHPAMVDAITTAYLSAGELALHEGMDWYPAAQALAKYLFDDIHLGAGVLAALSPLTLWSHNMAQAAAVAAGADPMGLPTLGNSRRAAARIVAGESWRDVLNGWKVRAFASAIESAGMTDLVCVDRHARDLAYGVPFTGVGGVRADESDVTRTEYRAIAAAYAACAERLHVPAPIVQAVTWVVQRGPAQLVIPVTEAELFLHNRNTKG